MLDRFAALVAEVGILLIEPTARTATNLDGFPWRDGLTEVPVFQRIL